MTRKLHPQVMAIVRKAVTDIIEEEKDKSVEIKVFIGVALNPNLEELFFDHRGPRFGRVEIDSVEDIYKTHLIQYPVEVTITATYGNYIDMWTTINIAYDDIAECIEQFEKAPIIKTTDHLWTKEVCGHTFILHSREYTKQIITKEKD